MAKRVMRAYPSGAQCSPDRGPAPAQPGTGTRPPHATPACRGYSVIELVVTLALVAIIAGLTALGVRSTTFDFSSARERVINEIRNARMDAVTRGAHYQIVFAEDEIRIERMADPDEDGVWEPDPDTEPKQIELPSQVEVDLPEDPDSGQPLDQVVEFDTRGMLARQPDGSMPQKVTVTVRNRKTGATRTLEIWPSGQVVIPPQG